MSSYFDTFIGWITQKFESDLQIAIVEAEDSALKTANENAIQNMVDGNYVVESPFSELFCSTLGVSQVHNNINLANTHIGRINAFGEHFPSGEFQEVLEQTSNFLVKNCEIAQTLPAKAAEIMSVFGDDSPIALAKALRCLNLAVLFTPRYNEKLLAEILDARAGVFLSMNDKEAALKDIKMAVILSPWNPTKLTIEMINQECNIVELRNPALEISDQEYKLRRDYCDNILFKVHGEPHPGCPSVSEFVCAEFHDTKGRRLTVNKDLPAGSVVASEEPYVFILADTFKWKLKRCSNCLKKIPAVFSCQSCVFQAYCSVKCRNEDWNKGHSYECSCFPFMHIVKAPRNVQLSLKAICKAGPEEIHKLFVGSKESILDGVQGVLNGEEPTCDIFSDNIYHTVLNLASHPRQSEMVQCAWTSIALMDILEKKTTFFDIVPVESFVRINFKRFAASVLMHHSTSFMYNTRALFEEVEINDMAHFRRDRNADKEIGCAVYPITSLINHSCAPNVFRIKLRNGRISFVTNQKLFAGDEILDTYGFEFLTHALLERKPILLQKFLFDCDCIACEYKWPIFQQLRIGVKFICRKCAECSLQADIPPFILNERDGICLKCGSVFEIRKMSNEVIQYEELMTVADALIKANKPREAIPKLVEAIEFFQMNLASPSIHMTLAQGTLAEALDLIMGSCQHVRQFRADHHYLQ